MIGIKELRASEQAEDITNISLTPEFKKRMKQDRAAEVKATGGVTGEYDMVWDKIRFNGEDSDGCIFTVIAGLSQFNDPQTVFIEFCKLHLKSYGSYYNKLYSHYVFSGPTSAGSHRSCAYAPKFATFLTDNKLGEVVGSPPTDNVKYHPGRKGQVFIWIPNQEAVEKWWTKNNPCNTKR